MKRYRINIKLSNGDEVKPTVMARNQADALRRLKQTPEVIKFIGGNEIVSSDIILIPIEPIDNKRFAVTTINNKPGWYVVADFDNFTKIEWKKGMYNETQRVLPIGNSKPLDAQKAATVMREIGEYLQKHFNELL